MKLAIITDSHAGVRNDNYVFLDNAKKFYDEVFFPTLKSHGITEIFHLGDILDRRKYINFVTANRLRVDFIEPAEAHGCRITHVLGNHDVYFKSTNAISGVIELYGNSKYPIDIITEPTEVEYDGLKILLVPWMTEDNTKTAISKIKNSKAPVCMGHLELSGFEMNKGSIMDHGFDPVLFDRFEVVASGHYHHMSDKGNVKYLGATGQFDWSDFDDLRGFHIFDTETLEFTHVPNPFQIFHKLYYNDTGVHTVDDFFEGIDTANFNDAYIKVVVVSKSNGYLYDCFIEAVEKAGPKDLQVIEEHLSTDLLSYSEIIDQADDTMTSIKKYVDIVGFELDKKELNGVLTEIYQEAVALG